MVVCVPTRKNCVKSLKMGWSCHLSPNVWLSVRLLASRKSNTKWCVTQLTMLWLFVTWKTLTQLGFTQEIPLYLPLLKPCQTMKTKCYVTRAWVLSAPSRLKVDVMFSLHLIHIVLSIMSSKWTLVYRVRQPLHLRRQVTQSLNWLLRLQ